MCGRTLFCTLLAFAAPAAHAAIIVVNTLADELNSDGDCSLREAVQAANTNVAVDACTAGNSTGAGDLILFAVNGEITLNSSITVTQALNISGNGPTLTRIGRPPTSCCFSLIRVMMNNPAHDFSLSQIAFYGYDQGDDVPGSAVQLRQVDRATLSHTVFWNHRNSAVGRTPWDYTPAPSAMNELVVEDSVFLQNTDYGPGGGGAMYLNSIPSIVIRRSRFIQNEARFQPGFGGQPGGAIRVGSMTQATISDCLFAFNKATSHSGGAIDADGIASGGQLTISRSTFVGNRSGNYGGALQIGSDLHANMVNTTLADNGQAISVNGGTLQVTHSTLLGPISGGGLVRSAGTVQIRRSLLHRGITGGIMCTTVDSGVVLTGGFNRYHQGDLSCGSGGSDLPVNDPRLLPLEDYGGHVPTLLPMIDSPLIDDAGFSCTDGQNNPVTDDARAFPRPVAASGSLARCDVGAVEWNPAFDDYLFKHGFNY